MTDKDNLTEDASETVSVGADQAPDNPPTELERYRRRMRRRVVKIVVAVAVVLCAGLGALYLFASGALAPSGAAAKYDFLSYVAEDDVTDYISTYKEQMGYGDVDDATWAEFLATYNLTPERLRQTTVQQLICDRIIEDWGGRLGVEIDDAELDAYIQSMRNAYAFNDDGIWQSTLEQYGRTEEQLRDTYRHQLVRQRVFTEEVPMPQVSDDQLRENLPSLVANYDSPTVKHSYCFKMQGLDADGSLEKIGTVQRLRKALIDTGVTQENFETLVTSTSDVESLVGTGGGNGWSCDTSEYGEKYKQVLEDTEVGDVSEVFNDGDGYAFIWVDQDYNLPTTAEEAAKLDLSAMPQSLHDFLADTVAYGLWQQDSKDWLDDQVRQANAILFEMPSDVSYNVDMSLAQGTDDAGADGSGDAAGSSSEG